ncbi:hypothetical protein MLD38_024246 [Melastoma candidum]|uniref:Uncharacterized protein n=1 Tax=Melastoma candidum TaxID=119954 RepID=A0ACB9NWQ3_9MYRT|nr:hypothetical protein MLD38_024246 [Melastoma candidum]
MAAAFAVLPAAAAVTGREFPIRSSAYCALFFKRVVENSFGSRALPFAVPSASPLHLSFGIAATSPSSTAAKPGAFYRTLESWKGYSR